MGARSIFSNGERGVNVNTYMDNFLYQADKHFWSFELAR